MCIGGGVCGVMDTIIGNEHSDTSSNPGWDYLHLTIPLGKV